MENKNFNILDAYKKYNNQLIILISGLSGTNKSKISQQLAKELNLKYLNTRDFLNKENFKEHELSNSNKVKVYDEYSWDKIIEKINELKSNGVLIAGEYFPSDKLGKLHIDMHIHIKLSKQNIIRKRLEYINSLDEEEKKKYNNEETETLIVNQILFPNYLENLQKSHINKFINANELIDLEEKEFIEKNLDKIFNEIIQYIIQYLKDKNLDKYIVY